MMNGGTFIGKARHNTRCVHSFPCPCSTQLQEEIKKHKLGKSKCGEQCYGNFGPLDCGWTLLCNKIKQANKGPYSCVEFKRNLSLLFQHYFCFYGTSGAVLRPICWISQRIKTWFNLRPSLDSSPFHTIKPNFFMYY